MRSFVNLDGFLGKVPADVVRRLSGIDFGRGTEALFQHQSPETLRRLAYRARVASIKASSAIEGVVVPDRERADGIIAREASRLRTRSEQELAGYRDALDYLLREPWQPLNVGLVLHLHRLLLGHTPADGGRLKTSDNSVVDRYPDGSVVERFRPVPAAQTEYHLAELVDRYTEAVGAAEHHRVLLAGLFVLDFSIIHPFDDGNGRVARLLTNALLGDAGYQVVRYVSLEQLVEDTADAYYQALFDSTQGWDQGRADPWSWLRYFVDHLGTAYEIFQRRASERQPVGTKQERVREYLLNRPAGAFAIGDIRAALPGISDQTIRAALERLKSEGLVVVEEVGRRASWRRIIS